MFHNLYFFKSLSTKFTFDKIKNIFYRIKFWRTRKDPKFDCCNCIQSLHCLFTVLNRTSILKKFFAFWNPGSNEGFLKVSFDEILRKYLHYFCLHNVHIKQHLFDMLLSQLNVLLFPGAHLRSFSSEVRV